MPRVAQKLFEIVYPRSYSDESYEDYEYLLCWYGRDGAFYQYMFYDIDIRTRVSANVINSEDSDRIESLITKESRTATLYAEDLSLNDVQIIAQMFANKKIIRLFKDGTTERIALESNSYNRNLTDGRYTISFDIALSDLPTWK